MNPIPLELRGFATFKHFFPTLAHKEDAHQGLEHTHCRLREKWWIIKGRQRVKAILSRCMKCKILKARPGTQVMSDLPECRLNVAQVFAVDKAKFSSPFTRC